MTRARKGALAALEARIGYRFKDDARAREALRHGSALDQRSDLRSNERLEFLGDRVLNLVIAEELFKAFPTSAEGRLAPRFNALVDRTACARVARRIGLGDALEMSRSEEESGGRDKDAILADACEALIAAIYLDDGFETARDFVLRAWAEDLKTVEQSARDAKSRLQEWAAARRKALRYRHLEREGPDHAPRFVVEAVIDDVGAARGEGGSKREAEQAAAKALLEQLE
ncbi:MAG: ribonuclease III [Hydrogenophilaceae bacterium]|nr:ribonuclease III [Hydrogenophilaceae bacterium]